MSHMFINGVPASAADLRVPVASNYGHFTALRVEDGAVRGLDLHLQRLAQSTRELFGTELDAQQVRAWLRAAIGDARGRLSLRVNVFSRAFDREHPAASVQADVLIAVAAAPPDIDTPLRLKSFRYARELAHVKHVGTFPLFHHRGMAQRAGFDDAVFVGADGCISEASIWNIGFWDGAQVVWPQAPQLDGVGMRLLQAGLKRNGVESVARPVHLDDLAGLRCAFLSNASTVARPVSAIDAQQFSVDAELTQLLQRCHASNPAQPV